MKAYRYDDNGYYENEIECQVDPRASFEYGTTMYLLPADSTLEQPLEPKDGSKVKFNGKQWEYEEIPEPEPLSTPSEEDIKQQEIDSLKMKLFASDYAIIKIAEGVATKEEYADLITQRAEWRARINELEG